MNRKKLALRLAAIPAAVLSSLSAAHAAVPTEVTTAIDTAGTDLKTAAAAVVASLALFWGVRKLGQKLGMW